MDVVGVWAMGCGLCCKHTVFLSIAMAGAGAGEDTAHA